MSLRNENPVLDEGDMRLKYKDKSETLTINNLISKEPIGQFKAWYEEVCNIPEVLHANRMSLQATLRDGDLSQHVALFNGFDIEGFKFFTRTAENDRELMKNEALKFLWSPLNRIVRIEGILRKNQEWISGEDLDRYFQSGPYANRIGTIFEEGWYGEPYMIEGIGLFKPPMTDSWDDYLVIPHSVEFWQGPSDHWIRFRRPKANETIDNILVHKGENGWVYEKFLLKERFELISTFY